MHVKHAAARRACMHPIPACVVPQRWCTQPSSTTHPTCTLHCLRVLKQECMHANACIAAPHPTACCTACACLSMHAQAGLPCSMQNCKCMHCSPASIHPATHLYVALLVRQRGAQLRLGLGRRCGYAADLPAQPRSREVAAQGRMGAHHGSRCGKTGGQGRAGGARDTQPE